MLQQTINHYLSKYNNLNVDLNNQVKVYVNGIGTNNDGNITLGLSDLADVQETTPTDNQVLTFSSGKWTNKNLNINLSGYATLDLNNKLLTSELPSSVALLDSYNKLLTSELPSSVALLDSYNKLLTSELPSSVALLDSNNKLLTSELPSSVALLDSNNTLLTSELPSSVALLDSYSKLLLSELPTSVVTLSGNQNLTYKTLDDPSNTITADNLRNTNGLVSINNTSPPSANQTLMAVNSTSASWQTIDHTKLTSIGTHTHSQIDNFINSYSSSSNVLKIEQIDFLKLTDFLLSHDGQTYNYDYFCVDSNLIKHNYVSLDCSILMGAYTYIIQLNQPDTSYAGFSFQLQIDISSGTKNSYIFIVDPTYDSMFGENQLSFNGTVMSSANLLSINNNNNTNTYKITYQNNSQVPWIITTNSTNELILNPLTDMFLINGYDAPQYTTNLYIDPTEGRIFRIKDINGHLNRCVLSLRTSKPLVNGGGNTLSLYLINATYTYLLANNIIYPF